VSQVPCRGKTGGNNTEQDFYEELNVWNTVSAIKVFAQ
jgi:hypothetical protein